MPKAPNIWPAPPPRRNHYQTLLDFDRSRHERTFAALLASMRQSVLRLEITLHKIAWRQAA